MIDQLRSSLLYLSSTHLSPPPFPFFPSPFLTLPQGAIPLLNASVALHPNVKKHQNVFIVSVKGREYKFQAKDQYEVPLSLSHFLSLSLTLCLSSSLLLSPSYSLALSPFLSLFLSPSPSPSPSLFFFLSSSLLPIPILPLPPLLPDFLSFPF